MYWFAEWIVNSRRHVIVVVIRLKSKSMRWLASTFAFAVALIATLVFWRYLAEESPLVADKKEFANKTIDEQIASFDDPGRLDRELASVNAKIAVAPTSKLLRKRGALLTMKREFSLAISAFDAAIDLDPQDADAFYNRGAVNSHLGNLEAAIDDYTSAIEADAGYSHAYSNRGMAYLDREEFDAALRDLQTAIDQNPDDHSAMHALAIVYLERDDKQDGDVIEALRLTRKACELTNYEYDLYIETLNEIENIRDATPEPSG